MVLSSFVHGEVTQFSLMNGMNEEVINCYSESSAGFASSPMVTYI